MIVFCHLLNDRSGSPRILSAAITTITGVNSKARLFVGNHGAGFLDNVNADITHYWYRRTQFRVLTLFTYLASQIFLILKMILTRDIDKNAIIYVNTLLPFGAALYGRITGRKVIYHLHEISIKPKTFKNFLVFIASRTSHLNIYVSSSHQIALPIANVPDRLIYNPLDNGILQVASHSVYNHRPYGCFNVLFIASLRDYKGIPELLKLAKSLCTQNDIHFEMVINDDQAAIDRYFSDRDLPPNLTTHPRTNDTSTFYARASLVMNLSRVDQCVETFGLTVLEAMAFGIPVVVPPVGGPAELVVNGVHGFHVDSYNKTLLREKVLLLYEEKELCLRMSKACRARAAEFSPDNFAANILAAIDHVRDADE